MNGFVYDDVWIVERNAVVHTLNWSELLTSTYWPEGRGAIFWRPAALVGFAVQWAVGKGGPGIFHALNICMYVVLCGLVGILCARLFDARLGLVAGVLFAAHPVHVEVFANVVGQAELWGALGYVGAMLAAWERSGTAKRKLRIGLLAVGVLCLLVGLGGKEQPVTIPGAVLVLWWLRAHNDGVPLSRLIKQEWPVMVTSCLVIAAYLWLRASFGGGVTTAGGIATGLDPDSALQRALVMLPVTLTWFRVLFVPIALSADYSPMHLIPEVSLGLNHAIAILLWTCLLALTFLLKDRIRALAVGIALFAVTVSVVSNVVIPLEVLMAERLLLMPSLGWAIALAGAVVYAYDRFSSSDRRRTLLVAVTVVAVLFAARSIQRATIWQTNDGFFAQLMADAPNSFRSHWASGHFAFEQGDSALGERELLTAVRLNPAHPQLLEDFGRLYSSTGRYEPAIPLLSQAVAIDSTRLSAALPLALALARTGRTQESLEVLDTMTMIHGKTRGILLVRGEVLMRGRYFAQAVDALMELVGWEPNVWSVRLLAAEAAFEAGECGLALAQADTALNLAPESEKASVRTFRAKVANGNANCK